MTNDELDAWRWAEALHYFRSEEHRPTFSGSYVEIDVVAEYRRLVREVIEPPAQPLTAQEAEDAFVAIAGALDRACCVGVACVDSWEPDGCNIRMFLSAERCRKWIAYERDRLLTSMEKVGDPNHSPAVDRDTLDTRAVLAGWEGRSLDADWLTDGAGFLAAKQALSEIKDRVRREEREAGKTYRHEVVWGEPWTSTQRDNCAELYGDGS